MIQAKLILLLFIANPIHLAAQPFDLSSGQDLSDQITFVTQTVSNELAIDTLREAGTPLKSGEPLVTGQLEYAIVHFRNESIAFIRPGSRLFISGEEGRDMEVSIRIDLHHGGLFLKLNGNNKSEFEITTSSSVIYTKNALFEVLASGFYWVDEGEIEVMALNSGQMVRLRAGMFAQTDEDGLDIITGQLTETALNQLTVDYHEVIREFALQNWVLQLREVNGRIID
jgi:hypothetical protein